MWFENIKGREHSEDLGVDGRIISELITTERGEKGVDWMLLVQDRDQWRVLVNTVIIILDPYMVGNFLTSFSRRTLLRGVS
jgi:hypothetical protein